MIFFIIEWLHRFGVKGDFWLLSSTRMLCATLTALIFTISLGPWVIRTLWALKIGQVIRREECPLLGQLHEKKKDTPTMGGILILSGMLLSLFLWMDWRSSLTLILLFVTLGTGLIGGYDDYLKLVKKNPKGLQARWKFSGQVIVALVVAGYVLLPPFQEWVHVGDWFAPVLVKKGAVVQSFTDSFHQFFIPFFKKPIIIASGASVIGLFVWIVLVVSGSSNAVNLTDGLDGLAAGAVMMVAATFALFAFLSNHTALAAYHNLLYIQNSGEIAVYLMAMVGACLGFLWYNAHPAQIFMGDVGSLTLGAVIGTSALLLRREFLLLLVGGIFVAEALSVILQVASYRLRGGKRIFLCSPLHHHFEYKGMKETKVVIRFWIVGLFLALLGLCSLKLYTN